MKFIRFVNHQEGQIYRYDALVVCGRKIDRATTPNGCYVLFNFFLVRKLIKDYIDANTWQKKPTMCFKRCMFSIRKVRNKEWTPRWDSVWCPLYNLKKE